MFHRLSEVGAPGSHVVAFLLGNRAVASPAMSRLPPWSHGEQDSPMSNAGSDSVADSTM
ncbi:MAG: hypothetical protein ACRDSE_01815 [Pseudonocardiaceae bacterium]